MNINIWLLKKYLIKKYIFTHPLSFNRAFIHSRPVWYESDKVEDKKGQPSDCIYCHFSIQLKSSGTIIQRKKKKFSAHVSASEAHAWREEEHLLISCLWNSVSSSPQQNQLFRHALVYGAEKVSGHVNIRATTKSIIG